MKFVPTARNGLVRTAKIDTDHIITRTPGWTVTSGTFVKFVCTCGWKNQTISGVKNAYAESHARQVRKVAASSNS